MRTIGTIHLAADHAGREHKDAVASWLAEEGFAVKDHGAFTEDPLDDYPDFIVKAATAVSQVPADVGLLFGGSGQGEAIMANRLPNVRATVYYGKSDEIIKMSREHNDANVLSIGARFVWINDCKRVIWDWLHTDTSSDKKYARRNQKIESYTRDFYDRRD